MKLKVFLLGLVLVGAAPQAQARYEAEAIASIIITSVVLNRVFKGKDNYLKNAQRILLGGSLLVIGAAQKDERALVGGAALLISKCADVGLDHVENKPAKVLVEAVVEAGIAIGAAALTGSDTIGEAGLACVVINAAVNSLSSDDKK